jgi:hypothetical protein
MVLFDFELRPPHRVKDLPAVGQRLWQLAQVFFSSLVAGLRVIDLDWLPGKRPGTLVRFNGR